MRGQLNMSPRFAVIWLGGVLAVQPVVAAAFIAAIGFSASLARAINGPAGTIGNLIVLVTAIASARPAGSAFTEAWLFAAGALWAVVPSSIVWPCWPHLPLRVALGKVFAELAAYCNAIAIAMMETITDQRVLALLLVPLAVAAVITRTRSYRLFVLLLTPVFVLVTDRWQRIEPIRAETEAQIDRLAHFAMLIRQTAVAPA